MEILVSIVIWVVMSFLFSLRDKTMWEVRIRFVFMMLSCVVFNYFVNVR